MTVLQVLGLHPYKLGSFEDYILAFAQQMNSRGYKAVYIFSGEPHPYIAERLEELDCQYYVQENPRGLHDHYKFISRLITVIREFKVDIIQAQFFPHTNFAVLAGFLTSTPVFQTVHTLSSLNKKPVRTVGIVKSVVSSLISKKIFAVSDAVRKDLIDTYRISPKKIQILYNGISLSKYVSRISEHALHDSLGVSSQAKIVLTIAHARPEKGLEYLIRAVPAVLEAHPLTQFVFCGGGPLEKDLTILAEETGIGGNVHFLGVRNDVAGLLRDSDICVLPSLSEASPYAILEAMAMSRAVVASDVGGIPELLIDGKTGFLARPADPGSLAAAINSLLDDSANIERFGVEGRKRVEEEFELNSRVLTEIEIYEDFLTEKSNPRAYGNAR